MIRARRVRVSHVYERMSVSARKMYANHASGPLKACSHGDLSLSEIAAESWGRGESVINLCFGEFRGEFMGRWY